MLTDAELKALMERGRGWPSNGYELKVMEEAANPPQRLGSHPVGATRKATKTAKTTCALGYL
jgi:hypothetical protein